MSITTLPGAVHRRQKIGCVIVRLAWITTDIISWFEVRVYLPHLAHKPLHHVRTTSDTEARRQWEIACEASVRAQEDDE